MSKERRKRHKGAVSTYKGLPLVDADKDLAIEITKRDVQFAKKNDPSNCAAAESIKRNLHVKEAEVHISRVYVKQGKKYVRYFTPGSIAREITSFDRGATFEPGEFTLKAPSKGQRLGRFKGENRSIRDSHAKKYNKPHVTINIREAAK